MTHLLRNPRVGLVACALFLASLAHATPVVSQLNYSGGAFFKLPTDAIHWLQADDQAQRCYLAHNEFSVDQPDGAHFYDHIRGLHFFLSVGGGYYSSDDVYSAWKLDGQGIATNNTVWTRPRGAEVSEYLVWQGQRYWFINDPRPEMAKVWYQVGPGNSCHVFSEASRAYGPGAVQTVVLESGVEGVPAWTITNGRVSLSNLKETGNWLYR